MIMRAAPGASLSNSTSLSTPQPLNPGAEGANPGAAGANPGAEGACPVSEASCPGGVAACPAPQALPPAPQALPLSCQSAEVLLFVEVGRMGAAGIALRHLLVLGGVETVLSKDFELGQDVGVQVDVKEARK